MGWEFDSPYVHMAYLRVAGRATVCEDHIEHGRNWKNETGRVLMITSRKVTLEVGKQMIFVPKKKVVAV